MSLVDLALYVIAAWTSGRHEGNAYCNYNTWKEEDFAKAKTLSSRLVLVRRDFLPGSEDLAEQAQLKFMTKEPQSKTYETASLLDVQAMLFLNYFKNEEKLYPDTYGRCEERFQRNGILGRLSDCGLFGAFGVFVLGRDVSSGFLGRAVRWKFVS